MSKSIAVAYSMKKKKKASGGSVESGDVTMNLSKGGSVDKHRKQYEQLQKKRGESYGAETKGVHSPSYSSGKDRGQSFAGDYVRYPSMGKDRMEKAKQEHKSALAELRDMPSPKMKAHGGEVTEGEPAMKCPTCGSHGQTYSGYQDGSHELDMIDSILQKRRMAHGGKTCAPGDVGGSPYYSKGGQVANDLGQGAAADSLPNEFDDLVLRDDEEMEGYTGKNSGDEIGGPSKSDVVSKAMLKRKKK